uniref:Fibronectin type-III domain-containing protein n=1 Tax=Eptatretus burgeri TaxID=7764 RepID=A0A8C4WXK8_EPTBU
MRPKGQRESRLHGSMQGFLRLLLIQIPVFFAVSCAQETTNETGPTTLTKPTATPTEPATTTLPATTGPSPPTNLTVVEQGVGFATVRWTAPNDPNKDSYIYHVTCYQCGDNFNFKTVYRTECDFANLSPGNIYTVNVSSSNTNNKFSQPATITFTAVPCGGKLRAEGRLSSPDYPQNIYSNMHCVWDIEAPLGHVVLLTVVDLTALIDSPSSQCDGSWLAVGYNQISQRDITMCHDSEVGRTIISTSNMLRVFYNKTVDVNVVRFNVTLSSQGNLFVFVV